MNWLATRVAELLPDVSAAALQRLLDSARSRPCAKDQPLLSAGARWQDLWLVERGALRLCYLDRHGVESNKNFIFEGQPVWPITPTLRSRPVDFSIVALEDTTVHALRMDDIDTILAAEPGWARLQLHALQRLLEEKMWREHLFLQCDARQRYLALLEARPEWCARLPLRHQASWLGITDVTLSRLRAALALR